MAEYTFADENTYEIHQIGLSGEVLASQTVQAPSSEAAARKMSNLIDSAEKILVCCDGSKASMMHVDFWKQRIRRN